MYWTASTVKLAVAVASLRKPQAGLLTLLIGAGLACTGPISDFPRASKESRGPTAALDPDRVPPARIADAGPAFNVPPDSTSDGAARLDAAIGEPPITGGLTGASEAGIGSNPSYSDAGSFADAALDGGVEGDASSEGGLVPDAGARDAGTTPDGSLPPDACDGPFAGLSARELEARAVPYSACNKPQALSMACNGQLAQATSRCAQASALMFPFQTGVASCLREDPALRDVPRACLDCYASDVLCALAECLVPCFDGTADSCKQCRQQHCSATFATCSGLPAH